MAGFKRGILPAAVLAIFLAASGSAVAEGYPTLNGQSIATGCHDTVRAMKGGGLLPQGSDHKLVGACWGAVATVFEVLGRLHDNYYKTRFPNLRYPIQDNATAWAWLSSTLLLGPDACLPKELSPGDAVQVVDRYAQAHPPVLKDSAFKFVADALSYEYSCGPKHPAR